MSAAVLGLTVPAFFFPLYWLGSEQRTLRLLVFQGDLVSFAWKTSSMRLLSLGSISRRSLHSCALSTSLWPVMLPRIEWASSRRWAHLATGENGSISSSGSSTRAGAGEGVLQQHARTARNQPLLGEGLRSRVWEWKNKRLKVRCWVQAGSLYSALDSLPACSLFAFLWRSQDSSVFSLRLDSSISCGL